MTSAVELAAVIHNYYFGEGGGGEGGGHVEVLLIKVTKSVCVFFQRTITPFSDRMGLKNYNQGFLVLSLCNPVIP